MSASPTTQRLTRASLRRGLTPHSVLTRMAQDAERADRIRQVKDDNPQLTWAQIAEKVGVTERSAIAWQQTGGIGHENAKRLAKLVGVDPDWLWSGNRPATPDLPALLNGDRAVLARIEAKLDQALEAQAEIQAALAQLTREPDSKRVRRVAASASERAKKRRAKAPGDRDDRQAGGQAS